MIGVRGRLLLLLLFTTMWGASARADVMLLIHGYQGTVFSWENSAVANVLHQFGWKRGAVLLGAPMGLIPIPLEWQDEENKTVNLQLNSEMPLMMQANVVTAAIRWINDRYPGEALITIASPHLGTALAYRGLDEIDDPFPINKIKEYFGGEQYDMLQRSRGLLHDIVPAIPGRLLYWLNTRKHPDIKYFSVVRSSVTGVLGDPIVSGFSQDMANVAAIGDRSTRLIQGFTHWLNILDGYALINITEQLD